MHLHELLESTKKDLHWLFTSDDGYTICLAILKGIEIRVTTTTGKLRIGRFSNIWGTDGFRSAALLLDTGKEIDAKAIKAIKVVKPEDLIRALLSLLQDDYFKHLNKSNVVRVVRLISDPNNPDIAKILNYIKSMEKK